MLPISFPIFSSSSRFLFCFFGTNIPPFEFVSFYQVGIFKTIFCYLLLSIFILLFPDSVEPHTFYEIQMVTYDICFEIRDIWEPDYHIRQVLRSSLQNLRNATAVPPLALPERFG